MMPCLGRRLAHDGGKPEFQYGQPLEPLNKRRLLHAACQVEIHEKRLLVLFKFRTSPMDGPYTSARMINSGIYFKGLIAKASLNFVRVTIHTKILL